jgi:hypothetical protein
MKRISRLPSPAFVVASLALFVALSGTAVAAGVVPLAKRALVADNSKKLGNKAPAQLVQEATAAAAAQPGPASSAAGLVSVKTQSDSVGAGAAKAVVVSCDGGKKVVSGGYTSDGPVLSVGSGPSGDASWQLTLLNLSETSAANVSLFAVCVA